MARHAVINKDGLVVNVIEWDGIAPWKPPVDHITVESHHVDRDDKYDHQKKVFTKRDGTIRNP